MLQLLAFPQELCSRLESCLSVGRVDSPAQKRPASSRDNSLASRGGGAHVSTRAWQTSRNGRVFQVQVGVDSAPRSACLTILVSISGSKKTHPDSVRAVGYLSVWKEKCDVQRGRTDPSRLVCGLSASPRTQEPKQKKKSPVAPALLTFVLLFFLSSLPPPLLQLSGVDG
ncbi:hypothetical protein AOLI_G00279760 [Acnodon oligacanthus]